MARQPVIQITCSRCTRVEHRPMSEAGSLKDTTPAFTGAYRGKKVVFEDLCESCFRIIDGHWKEINKQLVKMSPSRQKPTKSQLAK